MDENPLNKFIKKLEAKKSSRNNPLLGLIESMDNIGMKEVFFLLEKLIGKRFSEIADKESLKQSRASAVIPIKLWKAADFAVLPSDINTPKGIESLANFIYSEVLIHRILELPFSIDWGELASDKVSKLDDKTIIAMFWKGVEKLKVPISDALDALGNVGIVDTNSIFEAE